MFPFYCSTPSKKKALFWLKEAQDIGLEAELHIHRQRIVYERPPHHRTRSLRRMHRQIQMYGFTRNAP